MSVLQASQRLIKPPPKLTVSEWADQFRVLSTEASSEAGKFETARAMYQREIMDAISDPSIEEVVFMSGSQIGKTEVLLNTIGYYIHYDPAPMLMIQPTLDMARSWSQDRLATMLRDTPELKDRIAEVKSRDSGNTVLHKSFEGGHISACGANSPSSLASRPIKIVLCDEVDRYPPSAGSEGDPVLLAKRRSATFWDRKIVLTSTPTIKGASRIEHAYDATDKRKYLIPCLKCNHYQTLTWSNVVWEDNEPKTARYMCEKCDYKMDDSEKIKAIAQGYWKSTGISNGKSVGFHLSGLYSVWMTMEEAVREFLTAKKMPETLRVFVNTFLGESWEDEGEQIDEMGIYSRREDYDVEKEIPDHIAVISCGVDIQDDRIEAEVVGWGRDEESWSLEHKVIYGDPSAPAIWKQLDTFLTKTYKHPSGIELRIACTCIDSGYHTQQVYKFCKPRFARRVFAIKGISGESRPIIGRPTRNNIAKIPLFPVGVDTTKELVYSRLKIKEDGAGFCHFPKSYEIEYFMQLTAEKIVTRYYKGFPRREWVKTRPRNEALDLRVYAMAAFTALNTDINKLADRIDNRKELVSKLDKNQPNKYVNKRNSNFVNGWNK